MGPLWSLGPRCANHGPIMGPTWAHATRVPPSLWHTTACPLDSSMGHVVPGVSPFLSLIF